MQHHNADTRAMACDLALSRLHLFESQNQCESLRQRRAADEVYRLHQARRIAEAADKLENLQSSQQQLIAMHLPLQPAHQQQLISELHRYKTKLSHANQELMKMHDENDRLRLQVFQLKSAARSMEEELSTLKAMMHELGYGHLVNNVRDAMLFARQQRAAAVAANPVRRVTYK